MQLRASIKLPPTHPRTIGTGASVDLITTLEQEEIARLNRTIPDFAPGDTVIVSVNVVEGTRKRIQAYEGVVIAKRNRSLNSSFIVRKISSGEGVERSGRHGWWCRPHLSRTRAQRDEQRTRPSAKTVLTADLARSRWNLRALIAEAASRRQAAFSWPDENRACSRPAS